MCYTFSKNKQTLIFLMDFFFDKRDLGLIEHDLKRTFQTFGKMLD